MAAFGTVFWIHKAVVTGFEPEEGDTRGRVSIRVQEGALDGNQPSDSSKSEYGNHGSEE